MYRLGGWVEWGVMPNVLLRAVRWRSADTWRYMEIQAGDTDTRSGSQWSQDTASDGWMVEKIF